MSEPSSWARVVPSVVLVRQVQAALHERTAASGMARAGELVALARMAGTNPPWLAPLTTELRHAALWMAGDGLRGATPWDRIEAARAAWVVCSGDRALTAVADVLTHTALTGVRPEGVRSRPWCVLTWGLLHLHTLPADPVWHAVDVLEADGAADAGILRSWIEARQAGGPQGPCVAALEALGREAPGPAAAATVLLGRIVAGPGRHRPDPI